LEIPENAVGVGDGARGGWLRFICEAADDLGDVAAVGDDQRVWLLLDNADSSWQVSHEPGRPGSPDHSRILTFAPFATILRSPMHHQLA
jgi:hypothetical protein